MGIFAKGSQFPATVEADTPQNRYGGQFTKDSVAGDALGEVIGEVNATATSANDTVGEVIADVESLEGRVSALEGDVDSLGNSVQLTTVSGDGWTAYKQAGLVTLILTAVAAGFTVPTGYRPPIAIHAPIVRGAASHDARFIVGPGGTLNMYGTYTTPITGVVTYPAA